MDAYRVIITPRAASDLEQIRDYIGKASPDNAAANHGHSQRGRRYHILTFSRT